MKKERKDDEADLAVVSSFARWAPARRSRPPPADRSPATRSADTETQRREAQVSLPAKPSDVKTFYRVNRYPS